MRILIFIMFFLLLGGFFIISENKLVLNAKENYKSFILLYAEWTKDVVDNIGKVTGMIVKLEWLPKR
ncbi:hypothetical protein HYV49_02680 [Candidatus Pacearchaeota archaeon]|nr:hypothetical protein [Candidatus Pacearchaeota archaeon]